MAGIGFSLQRLLTQDRLSSNVRGYLHATVIAAGPWLFTCVALAMLRSMAHGFVSAEAWVRFSSITLSAFSLSLVVAGPFALVLSRCLADAIYAKDVGQVPSMMFKTLGRVFGLLALVGLAWYGWWLDVSMAQRVLGFALLMVTGGLWIVAALMSALRSYATVSVAFGLGLLLGCLIGYFTLIPLRELGLLLGLVVGLVMVFFIIGARLLAEFPAQTPRAGHAHAAPFALGAAMRRHSGLAWAGFFYSAAIWVDKWIMWLADEAQHFGRGVVTNADYEGAIFLAFLTIVPVMALFLIDVETRFHTVYQRYQQGIASQGTLRDIRRNHGAIVRLAATAYRRLMLMQCVLAVVAFVAAPAIMQWVDGTAAMASIFRFGVIGAAFHLLFIVTLAVLAYVNQQRWMVIVTAVFFFLNAGLTAVGAHLGEAYSGWGYAVAALASFSLAFYAAAHTIVRLPYMTFIGANAAIRETSVEPTHPLPRAQSVLSRSTPRTV